MTHEHLNDEQLSAHLDGEPYAAASGDAEAGQSVGAQVAACEVCRGRLAALAAARTLVRRPVVPVAPSVRAVAVEAAMAGGSAVEPGSPPTAPVAPDLPRRPARPARVLVAVAAVAAVLVVGVGVPLGLTHESPRTAPSALPVARVPSNTERSAGTPKSVAGSSATAAGVEDLGSVASPQALRSRLAPLLAPLDNGAFNSFAPSDATSKQSASSSAASPEGTGTPVTVPKQYTGCLAAALRSTGATEPLLVATATYDKTPALVVVVRPNTTAPTAAVSRRVVVVARTGCRVLARVAL